jgi:Tol biopolymer transport system component
MGEVYRARDTRLNRTVAVKVLPADVAGAVDRRERFEREAQAVAALNHPHICTLHDVVDHEGSLCLVMEHLEGETLQARLDSHRAAGERMPIAAALTVAIQIADALDKAHAAGILHRDIKPANIFLTKAGAKLLDFGLAKSVAPSAMSGVSILPTTPAGLTAVGTIVGSFQYMSPEQVEGQTVGPASDIFSFGCVLYEMVSGRKAFEGKTATSVIAAVLKEEPAAVSTMQPLTPPALDHVIARCLAKETDERWQSAGDLKRQLQWIAGGSGATQVGMPAVVVPSRRVGRRELIAWVVAAMAIAAAAVVVRLPLRRSVVEPSMSRLLMPVAPADNSTGEVAISRDGTRVAYVGRTETTRWQLYVRALNELVSRPIVSTAVVNAAFSPDGQWIAFGDGDRIKKVPVAGGPPTDLCAAGRGGAKGITWASNDLIVFAAPDDTAAGIRRVAANGGDPVVVTNRDVLKEASHFWPIAVPGGRYIVFAVQGKASSAFEELDIDLVALDGGSRRHLLHGGIPFRVLPSGHLLFARGRDVLAVAFDLARGEVHGAPVSVLAWPGAGIDVSDTGTVVMTQGGADDAARSLTWVDRERGSTPIALPQRAYYDPRLSPDGQRLVVEGTDAGDDIWVVDLRRGTTTRLSFDPGEDETPAWAPDGRWVAYAASRAGQPRSIYRKASDGSGSEELLFSSPDHMHVDDWSHDGRSLLLTVDAASTKTDIWVLPLDGSGKAAPLLNSAFAEANSRLSPDGRWIAYESNESGRSEVYVQRFPALGGKVQVSTDGGGQPVWAVDGHQLFYRGGGRLISVSVGAGDPLQLGAATPLLDDTFVNKGANHVGYDVAADGRRFVFARETASMTPRRYFDVTENWLPELLRRVPVR